jgi:hypothetical protein
LAEHLRFEKAELTSRKFRRPAHHRMIEVDADIRKRISEWNNGLAVRVDQGRRPDPETLAASCERINDSGH